MSLYVKNMNREFHNNKYLAAFGAREADRGRRNLDDGSNYKKDDFLTDVHVNTRNAPNYATIATSSTRDSKFKPGFYRRHGSQINNTVEREIQENRKMIRSENHYHKRLDHLAKNNARHGDIISHPIGPTAAQPTDFRPWRGPQDKSTNQLETENKRRQMRDPNTRFHTLVTEEERDRHRQRREAIQKGLNPASSDMGFGRRDFQSNGVADNFTYEPHAASQTQVTRLGRAGRAQVHSNARLSNFHVGEQGRSPIRGNSPANIRKSPTPNRFLSAESAPSPQMAREQNRYY
jgi:hypothetical protein